jgi:hypothetical protein
VHSSCLIIIAALSSSGESMDLASILFDGAGGDDQVGIDDGSFAHRDP